MKRKSNHKQRKYHFQLLEVMIALFLVALCAIPVVSVYVNIYKDQKKLSQTLEIDHLANIAHAKIIEDLYFKGAKGGSLSELLNKKFSLRDLDAVLLKDKFYDFEYILTIEKPVKPKTQDKAIRLLLDLKLDAVKKDGSKIELLRSYNYKACVIKIPKVGQEEELNGKNNNNNKKTQVPQQ